MDKRTSQRPGDPDFLVLRGDASGIRAVCVEFKMPGNLAKHKRNEAQIHRFAELKQAGCNVRVCYDLASAISHVESSFGLNEATGHPAQPNKPSGAVFGNPVDHRFWLAHSNALGPMVVAKDQTGKWCGIRVATAEDRARFPRLGQGMME